MIECYCHYNQINSRVLLSESMKNYKGINIDKEEICRNKNGKPFFANTSLPKFNISHTKGLTVLALSNSSDVGIDVEETSRNISRSLLNSRLFSQEEKASFKTTMDFLTLWTKKESAIKCIGGTIATDFTKTSFDDDKVVGDAYQGLILITKTFFLDNHILSITAPKTENIEIITYS